MLRYGAFYGPGTSMSAGGEQFEMIGCLVGGTVGRATRRRAPPSRRGGGHYEPFLGGHEQAAETALALLRLHLLDLVCEASRRRGASREEDDEPD